MPMHQNIPWSVGSILISYILPAANIDKWKKYTPEAPQRYLAPFVQQTEGAK